MTVSAQLTHAFRWHRPLMVLAAAMALSTVVAAVGMIVDPRMITGIRAWDKPFKFSVSVLIYSVTWAWLIHQLRRARRFGWWAGTIAAVCLGVEMVCIIGAAAAGTTSHFNVSTPLHTAIWATMGASIAVLWVATFVVTLVLFANPGPDPARNLAIRAGAVLALIGMALGFLMTIPTAAQLADFHGIAGAHTVGLADGGPGLPVLGWSTVGGDLRIPHFVGMHALQALPLALIALEALSGRVRVLRSGAVRTRLVGTLAVGYAGLIGLVTWQALRGQSIARPDARTLAALAGLVLVVALGVVWSLRATKSAPAPDRTPQPVG